MKKIFAILLVLVVGFCFCSCSENEPITEDSLLYFCGVKTLEDIEKIEFIYEEYQYIHEGNVEITESEDLEIFKYYKYQSDFPDNRLHELFIFPCDKFTLTVNGKLYNFYLHEDGSLTSVPAQDVKGLKTYQADEEHRITKDKFNEWIIKYDKHIISQLKMAHLCKGSWIFAKQKD